MNLAQHRFLAFAGEKFQFSAVTRIHRFLPLGRPQGESPFLDKRASLWLSPVMAPTGDIILVYAQHSWALSFLGSHPTHRSCFPETWSHGLPDSSALVTSISARSGRFMAQEPQHLLSLLPGPGSVAASAVSSHAWTAVLPAAPPPCVSRKKPAHPHALLYWPLSKDISPASCANMCRIFLLWYCDLW